MTKKKILYKQVTVVGLSVLATFSSFKQNREEQSFSMPAVVGTTDVWLHSLSNFSSWNEKYFRILKVGMAH